MDIMAHIYSFTFLEQTFFILQDFLYSALFFSSKVYLRIFPLRGQNTHHVGHTDIMI